MIVVFFPPGEMHLLLPLLPLFILSFIWLLANPRKSAPSIRVRFPSETYALAGYTTQLECFAYGK